ncbi:MAG: hypothetical protein ACWGQW_00225 [bacterium]
MRLRTPWRTYVLARYIWRRGWIVPLDLYVACVQYGFDMRRMTHGV